MTDIYLFILVACFILVWLLVADDEKKINLIRNRQHGDSDIGEPEYQYSLSAFEKYDVFAEKRRLKALMSKFEKPVYKETIIKSFLYLTAWLAYKFYKNEIGHENFIELILISLAVVICFVIIHKFVFLPSYYKTFDEYFPSNVRLFAQELVFRGNIQMCLNETKNYAHPEFYNVCKQICRLNNLGLSITQAVSRVSPKVRSQKLLMFLVVVKMHDTTGGCLATLLQNLSDLFDQQNLLQARVSKITIVSKISLAVSIFYLPMFMLFLYYFSRVNFDLLMHDPIGWLLMKIMIVLYLINLALCRYFLKIESL